MEIEKYLHKRGTVNIGSIKNFTYEMETSNTKMNRKELFNK